MEVVLKRRLLGVGLNFIPTLKGEDDPSIHIHGVVKDYKHGKIDGKIDEDEDDNER